METIHYKGRFMMFTTIETQNSKGKKVVWEYITRPTYQGVDVIAELDNQFIVNIEKRYPINSYVISFPGGICDNEDVKGQAIKELREETGYSPAEHREISLGPLVYIDPWKSTEKTQYAHIHLAPNTSDTQQELEELEEIRTKFVPKDSLLQEITELSIISGAKIDSRLYSYALGKSFAQNYLKPNLT
jgi:8-oxo-dGTP pyrophosphatase MutT (NUDIX family)